MEEAREDVWIGQDQINVSPAPLRHFYIVPAKHFVPREDAKGS